MSAEGQPSDSHRGYLSDDSKRRFTLIAGVLGAVFFLAQVGLPMVVMFAFMVPTITMFDLDERAAVDGRVLMTNDRRIEAIANRWLEQGRAFRGLILWPQRHYSRLSYSKLVKLIESPRSRSLTLSST